MADPAPRLCPSCVDRLVNRRLATVGPMPTLSPGTCANCRQPSLVLAPEDVRRAGQERAT